MTQRKPHEMPHSLGQGLPQRMGTPYYPSLSLSLLPSGIWSPSSVRSPAAPSLLALAMMSEAKG